MYWEQRLNHGKELECIVSIVETYCLFFIHPPLLGHEISYCPHFSPL